MTIFESDLLFTIWWYLIYFAVGVVFFPITQLIFKKYFDLGWGFTKTIGFLVSSYVLFVLSTYKILPFSKISILIIFLAFALINAYLFKKKRKQIIKKIRSKWKTILLQEILFVLVISFWAYVRGHQPDINGLEKFMDFGFINSILKSNYLPPIDMWFSGEKINYYWFGHYFIAFITKTTSIPLVITYNLSIATIMGSVFVGVFSVVSTLASKIKAISKKNIVLAALISSLILCFGGNFHTMYYIIKDGAENYWYPDATRFIGYNPETDDKTIHEFPQYSFVVSDLHAHLINLPFVIIFIALLYNYFRKNKGKIKYSSDLLVIGFVLGIMFMTNTWDFGNYLILTAVSFLIFFLSSEKLSLIKALKSSKNILLVLIVSIVTALPFLQNFESITKGVKLVHSQSPLWQLLILWGFPLITGVALVIFLVRLSKKIYLSDYFVLGLYASSLILIIIPEVFYMKDIYIETHYRANTMFKLTYQGFVMSYLSSGYAMIRILDHFKKSKIRYLVALISSLLLYSILTYPYHAIKSYYSELKDYKGLDGSLWIKQRYPNTFNIINWFNNLDLKKQPVILEASGDSYTEYNIISSFTGYPTLSGWFVHEWLWRGDSSFPQKRVEDITNIYLGNNQRLVKNLINKYKIDYIVVGYFERLKFPNLNEDQIAKLSELVYSSSSEKVYKVNKDF